jgi:hypothetical protein
MQPAGHSDPTSELVYSNQIRRFDPKPGALIFSKGRGLSKGRGSGAWMAIQNIFFRMLQKNKQKVKIDLFLYN